MSGSTIRTGQVNTILSKDNIDEYPNYHAMSKKEFRIAMSTLYHLVLASVRSADRSLVHNYIDTIALKHYALGFSKAELISAITAFSKVVTANLHTRQELSGKKQDIYDYVGLTLQLAVDEVEDVFDNIDKKLPAGKIKTLTPQQDIETEKQVKQLSAFYQEYSE